MLGARREDRAARDVVEAAAVSVRRATSARARAFSLADRCERSRRIVDARTAFLGGCGVHAGERLQNETSRRVEMRERGIVVW